MLHITTIIVFMVFIHVICTFLLQFLWIQNRGRFEGTGHWAINIALKAAALILIVMSGIIPVWMSTVFATSLILLAEIILYQGLAVFLQIRVRRFHNFFLLGLFVIIHGYFSIISGSLPNRNLVLSITWLIINIQTVWLLFISIKPEFRIITLSTGISVVLYSIINISRIIEYFINSNPEKIYMEAGMFEAVTLIAFQVVAILLTYSLSLMVNKRLTMDIELQEEKYSKAFHSSPYAVMLTRMCDGKIFEANGGFEFLSGYSISEAVSKTTAELNFFYNDGERNEVLKELDEYGNVRDKEMKFRTKSGDILVCLYSADMIHINKQACIISTISDITELKIAEAEREHLIEELSSAFSEIKTLGGMLPICSSCKKIRDDSGYWQQIESYIRDHTDTEFSHGLCPDCVKRLYPDLADSILNDKET